nr:NYN domain-containing protein [Lachnospiraceae bacterium]
AYKEEQELAEIFPRTFGEIKRRVPVGAHTLGQESDPQKSTREQKRKVQERETARSVETLKRELSEKRLPEYLLVDGYNVIFAWDDLAALAKTDLAAARGRLMDILCNYQGYTSYRLILVFDAYRVKGNPGEVQKYHNIHVVYTKEAETADMYIEKVSHELGKKYHVTVATSDALEQLIVIGQGAVRMSSRELKEEVERVGGRYLAEHAKKGENGKNTQMKDALVRALAPGQEGE